MVVRNYKKTLANELRATTCRGGPELIKRDLEDKTKKKGNRGSTYEVRVLVKSAASDLARRYIVQGEHNVVHALAKGIIAVLLVAYSMVPLATISLSTARVGICDNEVTVQGCGDNERGKRSESEVHSWR